LKRGDHLLYDITIESSQKITDFNRAPQVKNSVERTKFRLIVEDIPEPGIYLLT